MKRGNLDDIPNNGAGSLLFRDAARDDVQLEDANLPLCQFERVGLKAATIKRSKLSQCLFVDVYLSPPFSSHLKMWWAITAERRFFR
jgi:hypothetical protein